MRAATRTIAPTVKPLALAVALALASGPTLAAPTNGVVVFGNAQITTPAAGTTLVQQTTSKAIVNWNSFSIGASETVRFQQPDATSIALNRVTGTDPSSILGNLQANGKVFLVNQNGILFGAQSHVDVGSMVASTLDISDSDFVAGTYRFSGTSTAAVQVAASEDSSQRAQITAADRGTIALLGATVNNNGNITALLGTVGLASGETVTLNFADDGLTQIAVTPASINALVQNGGAIIADGGQIILRADAVFGLASSVVNQAGTLRANATALVERNGVLTLDAGPDGVVTAGGTMTATSLDLDRTGGAVTLTGHNVDLQGSIDVSGRSGGGTITADATGVGSDANYMSASATINANAVLRADATASGDGGTITAISYGNTSLYGAASANAGPNGGNGGQIRTTGTYIDDYGFRATASPGLGTPGTWTVDASNIRVDSLLADSIGSSLDANTNVVVSTHFDAGYDGSPNIVINAPISSRGVAALTFNSVANIVVGSGTSIDARSRGGLVDIALNAGLEGIAGGTTTLMSGASIASNGGAITLTGNGVFQGNEGPGVLLTNARLDASIGASPNAGTAYHPASLAAPVTLTGTGPTAGVVVSSGSAIVGNTDVSLHGEADAAGGVGVDLSGAVQAPALLTIAGYGTDQAATGVLIRNATLSSGPSIQSPSRIVGVGATGSGVVMNNTTYTSTGRLILGGESQADAPGLSFSGAALSTGYVEVSALNHPGTDATHPMIATDATNASTIAATGYVNFRPGGVNASGAVTDALDVPIAVGSNAYPFQVQLSSFGLGGSALPQAQVVIGSSAQRGAISYGDVNPFYGNLTLQNGGANSGGIVFTTPLTVHGQAVLSSGGLVTSVGNAITADRLLLNGTQGAARFQLTNAGNSIGMLSAVYDTTSGANASSGIDVVDSTALTVGAMLGVGYTNGNITSIPGFATNVAGNVQVQTAGALTLQQDISATAGITLATGTVLDNSASATLNPGAGYGWHVFADTWVGETRGGLVPAAVHPNYYNCAYGAACSTAFAALTDNHFIYRAQPTLVLAAAPVSRAYGDANPALTYSITGYVNNDTSADARAGSFVTSATAASNVGSYGITGSFTSPVGYALVVQPSTLTVNPAPLLITADNQAKVYGGTDPLLTATYTGLKLGQQSVNGLTLATTTGAAATAGTHAITASGAANPNYSITYQPGVLTVSKAALAVIADNKQKVYGGADPVLTASYMGLQYDDTPALIPGLSLTTTTGAAATAGTHAITLSGASAASNYDVTYQPGVLTVSKAALAVIADNKQKVYGAADPLLTASYSGLQYNDTPALISGLALTTTTGAAATAGTHAITLGGGAAANYDVTYTPGVLTVAKAALTVTANDQSKVYGAADPALTASLAGLQYSDTASVLSGLALTTTTGAAANVGTHAITGSGATAANYTVAYQPGALTVTPAVLTYTATPATLNADTGSATFTGSVTGFVYGESLATATTGLATFDTSATRPFATGTYAVLGSGLTAANYRFVQAPANQSALTVLAATHVTPTDPSGPSETPPVDPLVVLASLAVIPEINRDLNFTSSALYDRNVGATRVCVGSGAFASNSSAGDLNDALGLEWSRVRISPNLSNCFSLGERNGCSDF